MNSPPCAVRAASTRSRRIWMPPLFLGILIAPLTAWSQIFTPPPTSAQAMNGLGLGVSYGEQNDKDADFWGLSVDYSRWLGNRWTVAAALTWDEETERFVDRPDSRAETYTLVGTVSYNVTPRLTLTTGLGQGIANDDNKDNEMRFSSGDLGTGIAVGYSIPLARGYSISLSTAYEYNLSENETSISVDVSLGWSF